MATSATSSATGVTYLEDLKNTPVKRDPDAFNPADQKDLFLKLLIAQLKNQDPTSPMDQKEMMGQMAQMTSVEQMANMSKSIGRMETMTMIGKTIDYNDTAFSPPLLVQGVKVDAVRVNGGDVRLELSDGKSIESKQVVAVRDGAA